ncbi:MAG TPA: hypothetical protein VIM16_08715 [Mucilaginibacter sp.]|jgi:hypothetical protein
MNKFIVPILFTTLIFFACNQREGNSRQNEAFSDEAEITTLIFNASVYPDTTFKEMLLEERSVGIQFGFKGVIKLDKNDQKKFDLESDSLKKELDTAKVYVLIADSLLTLQKNYLQSKLISMVSINGASKTDTTLNNWIRGININDGPKKFDLKNLSSKYNYRCVLNSKFRRPKGNVFIAGTFSMSSVFFNKERNKAFVYTTFVCGGLCGEGRDIYLAKRKGKWVIVWKRTDWVS